MRTPVMFLLLSAGCTSNGSGSDAGPAVDARAGIDARTGGGGGTLTWILDGMSRQAVIPVALRKKNTGIDYLQVTGSTTGEGIGFLLTDVTPNKPGALSGPYNCPGGTNQEVIFTSTTTGSDDPMSCTITITSAGVVGGAHATGTFEAVLSNGKLVTDGIFDLPVMAAP